GAVRASHQDLATSLAIAGGVEHDAFALTHAAEGGLVAQQLQSVDRLPSFADQQPVVVFPADDRVDPVVVLAHLNLTFKVKLVKDSLDELSDPLGRRFRPLPGSLVSH